MCRVLHFNALQGNELVEVRGCQGVVVMGRPHTVVCGNVSMHMSTSGQLVTALLPRKDGPSLCRVIAELTQNVMDWALAQVHDNSLKTRDEGYMSSYTFN